MAMVSLRQLLDHAAENGYGVPAFNVNAVVSNNSTEACDRLVAWAPRHLCSRFC